jgi:hypothetical protein
MHIAVFYQVGAGRSDWRQKLKEFARNICGTGNIIVLHTVWLDKAKLKLSQAVFPFTKLESLLA